MQRGFIIARCELNQEGAIISTKPILKPDCRSGFDHLFYQDLYILPRECVGYLHHDCYIATEIQKIINYCLCNFSSLKTLSVMNQDDRLTQLFTKLGISGIEIGNYLQYEVADIRSALQKQPDITENSLHTCKPIIDHNNPSKNSPIIQKWELIIGYAVINAAIISNVFFWAPDFVKLPFGKIITCAVVPIVTTLVMFGLYQRVNNTLDSVTHEIVINTEGSKDIIN